MKCKNRKYKKMITAAATVMSLSLCAGMMTLAGTAEDTSAENNKNYEATAESAQSSNTPDSENGGIPEKPGESAGAPGEAGESAGGPGESQGGPGGPGGSPGGPGGSKPDSYDAVNEYTEDTQIEGESFVSEGTNENAILVSGGTTVLKDITVNRTSSDSTGGDQSSFYGVGSAILVKDGMAYISGADIKTDSAGAAGAFAYDSGVVYIADSTIETKQNTSGGIHAAGGGTLYAYDVTAVTNGGSSAAIRSDRGGGTMIIDGGSYTSNGSGSPAIYCTAEIAVNEADLAATASEAICIEGKNSIYLYDCNLSGNMPEQEQNDCDWNVILYQSMSGDSEVGNSTFQMVGGTLTAFNGGMFYTTNTQSTFLLSGVDITYAQENDFFLKATGNSNQRGWGKSGANGARCTFTAQDQQMQGDILWDSISTLDFYMQASALTGSVINDESNAGEGGDGYANLYIDKDSVWTVTGDSTLTGLYNAGTIVDAQGRSVTVVGTDGTEYVSGDSEYTITVEVYSEEADMSGAGSFAYWSEFAVEKPEALN